MNGINGVSFQEVPGGLIVHVKKTQKSSKSSSAGRLKKRLPYSFKQMSKQIQQAKTADAARPLVARMQAKLTWLYKKLRSGEYGESEIAAAIIHATSMERIAKRKVRHLEEEEAVEGGSGTGKMVGRAEEIADEGETEEFGKERPEKEEDINGGYLVESMKRLKKELEDMEREMAQESMPSFEDLCSMPSRNLTEEELKDLKRKHRSEEERQLMHADLKYLKALFDRLEQEKKQTMAEGSHSDGGHGNEISYVVDCTPELEMGDINLGENIDITV